MQIELSVSKKLCLEIYFLKINSRNSGRLELRRITLGKEIVSQGILRTKTTNTELTQGEIYCSYKKAAE